MRMKFQYKNHAGKVEERDVDVVTLAFDFNVHPEFGYQPSWFIGGWDYSRGRDGSEYRSFYLSNMVIDRLGNQSSFELVKFAREPEQTK